MSIFVLIGILAGSAFLFTMGCIFVFSGRKSEDEERVEALLRKEQEERFNPEKE